MKRLSLIIGLLLCIPVVWNYLQPTFFHLHDFTHVTRLVELENAIADGQTPPRWSENLGYGYGLPQFSFYGNLFYFEALIFRTMGLSPLWSIKLAVIAQVLVSFGAIYALGSLLANRWIGLLMGIAGIYAPYRLVDMYVRGAFGELSGMTFFSLTLLAVVYWAKKPTLRSAILIGISGSGIILSHNLIALISAPFVMLWILFWAIRERLLQSHLFNLFIAAVLAVGLSAFYAIPALLEKSFTQVDKLTAGFSNYNHHFLYIRQFWQSTWGYGGSIWGIDDNVSFELGKLQIILVLLIMGYCGLFWLMRKKHKNFSVIVMAGFLLLLSLFMAILKSKPVWDAIPLLSYVQFPWRFLSISIILLPIPLIGLARIFPDRWQPFLMTGLSVVLVATQFNHAKPEEFLINETDLYYVDSKKIKTHMSGIIPDFLPIDARPDMLPSFDSIEKFSFYPDGNYEIEVDRSHEFLIASNNMPFESLTIHIFDFPGWTIYFDGAKVAHTTTKEGLIQVIPINNQFPEFISGRFEETPIRLWSDIVSLISILIVGTLLWKQKK